MRKSFIYRLALSAIVLFVGVSIASFVMPDQPVVSSRIIIITVAALGFGILGFIMPELVAFFARLGFEKAKEYLLEHFPNAAEAVQVGRITSFGRRRKAKASKYVNPLVVDTSALIDGRLGDIVKAGFLQGSLIVIPSVIVELHQLSDSKDDLKRARGRRGLDVLAAVKDFKGAKLEILESEPSDSKVDTKLVVLAKKMKAGILTVDFNLGKVAKIKGLRVLNINELANALKTVTLPGEELRVSINTAGKGKDQGVGFLDDGTMVVVENGSSFVGRDVKVKVNKVLQTAAGKMIFGRLASN